MSLLIPVDDLAFVPLARFYSYDTVFLLNPPQDVVISDGYGLWSYGVPVHQVLVPASHLCYYACFPLPYAYHSPPSCVMGYPCVETPVGYYSVEQLRTYQFYYPQPPPQAFHYNYGTGVYHHHPPAPPPTNNNNNRPPRYNNRERRRHRRERNEAAKANGAINN